MGRLLTGATNLGRHWWHWICRVLYMRPLVLSGFDAEGDFHSDCPPSGATSWIKSLDLNLCTRGGNFTYRWSAAIQRGLLLEKNTPLGLVDRIATHAGWKQLVFFTFPSSSSWNDGLFHPLFMISFSRYLLSSQACFSTNVGRTRLELCKGQKTLFHHFMIFEINLQDSSPTVWCDMIFFYDHSTILTKAGY